MREVSSLGGFGQFVRTSTCNVCRGQGSIVKEPCETVAAPGACAARATVKVEVPAGIAHGQRLRITGEGGAGAQGGRAGDLYVAMRRRADEHFVRDGDDLIYRLDITMIEAALGTTVYVPALDGDFEVELPAGHAAGRGQGLPQPRRAGRCRATAAATSRWSSTCWCRGISRPSSASCSRSSRQLTDAANYEPDQSFFDKVRAVFRQ